MATTKALPVTASLQDNANGARLAATWLADGWRLFRRAPSRLFGLLVAMLAIEGLLQFAIPVIGIPVSKWVMGMLGGVYWMMLWQLNETGKLRPLDAFRRISGRWLALAGLSCVLLVAFLMQIAVASVVIGSGAVDMFLFGELMPVSTWQLGLVFAIGVPVSTLLMFAAPLLLLKRVSLATALSGSVRMFISRACPMTLLVLLTMILVALAPASFALSVVLSGPWLMCTGLVAYLDIIRTNARND